MRRLHFSFGQVFPRSLSLDNLSQSNANKCFLLVYLISFKMAPINTVRDQSSLILHSNLQGLTGSPDIGQQLLPALPCCSSQPAAHQVACHCEVRQIGGRSWNACHKETYVELSKFFLKIELFVTNTCHPQHPCHTACPASFQDDRNIRWSIMGRLQLSQRENGI